MVANIDLFRDINATFGPLAGDTILREVARRFRSALRLRDSIGRPKADEFVIVLPQDAAWCRFCPYSLARRRSFQGVIPGWTRFELR